MHILVYHWAKIMQIKIYERFWKNCSKFISEETQQIGEEIRAIFIDGTEWRHSVVQISRWSSGLTDTE